MITNQWLGVVAWHLLPVFYRLCWTFTNKPKPYHPLLLYKSPQLPKFIIKEYK